MTPVPEDPSGGTGLEPDGGRTDGYGGPRLGDRVQLELPGRVVDVFALPVIEAHGSSRALLGAVVELDAPAAAADALTGGQNGGQAAGAARVWGGQPVAADRSSTRCRACRSSAESSSHVGTHGRTGAARPSAPSAT